ncbi:unnamed protein product [Rhizoctonia solani]|uniref:Uncharacterized protein n=1 Tax=Rhizoctonia solani TaxID=456999 RepID=A0A8H3DDY4_9AGAM|nr:unnamed protein product [Rhizoctonia solani]CAE6519631.1 unnamed protein product [Rhizoctonia solani]
MSRYIVISGAPTLREIRSGTTSAPQWRVIRPYQTDDQTDDTNLGVDSNQESLSNSYSLRSGEGASNFLWPPSQSQSQSQTQSQLPTQPETFLQTSVQVGQESNRTDSITSISTASTLPETETFPTHTFRMTNTLPNSQTQSISSASSSIANFPTFHFSLRTLTPLRVALTSAGRGSVKANLLVAVMEVDGPDMITTKAGQETHMLKLVVGDDEGAAGKITVWGDTALEWAGARKMMGLRRGDIVYLSGAYTSGMCTPEPTDVDRIAKTKLGDPTML